MRRGRIAELSRSIIGLAVYALCACFAHTEIPRGKIVKIADGDTSQSSITQTGSTRVPLTTFISLEPSL
jgi:hypothetical protein